MPNSVTNIQHVAGAKGACAVTHPSGSTHWSRRRYRVSEFATVMKASRFRPPVLRGLGRLPKAEQLG
jgi:hypothetical protein